MIINQNEFPINCTDHLHINQEILFSEAVFDGANENANYKGGRSIVARILKDSKDKQQHNIFLEVVASDGESALQAGTQIIREYKDLVKAGTFCKPTFLTADLEEPIF